MGADLSMGASVKLRYLLAALALTVIAAMAHAASPPVPLITGPQDLSQMRGTLNTLINQINAILVPAFPAGAGAVNFPSLSGGVTGQPIIIGVQAGGDANASISIQPAGSGNLILMGQANTGVVQFGNLASFVSAPSLSPYPGRVPSQAAIQGVHNTAQGVLLVKDWLGVTRGVPAY